MVLAVGFFLLLTQKMARTKLRPGVGCEFTCLKRNIHPPKKASRKCPDYCKRDATLDGCLMLREGVKRTSGKVRKVYFFTHIDFPDDELYICKGFVRITKEGGNEGLFEIAVEHNEESTEGREIPEKSHS